MGRSWYKGGRLSEKKNTFYDFIHCARHLIDSGLSRTDGLCARGGSAGGLLMGAAATMAPELFNTVIAEVPFVDCLNTISNPEMPLTVTEWEEWGNPLESLEIYDLMASYAPYENVGDFEYPTLVVTAGLNDPRVSYFEPAKWVASIREKSPKSNIVLKCDMGFGHSGPSGRYEAWEEEAGFYALLIAAVSR
jgi:oligopeptidase B